MSNQEVRSKEEIDNEKEYQKYAEKMAAWDRFKQEVRILKIYKFESRQLMEYIRLEYKRK